MIITLRDKTIKTFVDDSNIQQNDTIDVGNTSVNYGKNITLFSIFDVSETVTNFNVSVTGSNFTVAYRDGLTSDFKESNTAGDTELKISDRGGKQVRKWNMFLIQDTEGAYTDTVTVSYELNGNPFSYDFSVKGYVIGLDPKYIVLTQNFKFDITQDYYKAFKDSEHQSSEPNELLLNEKRKEFLLNYFDLTAQVGSYHTLLAALHYFGYGELLSVRELWKNSEGRRQSTKITTEVQNFIDNRLLGFTKTNQLQLVYKINDEDGTEDADGFPNYINILFDTEELLIKMYALKRLLEKDFLPLNTKIVDIIGEHTSTLGVDVKVFLNNERIDEVDLNNQSGEDGDNESGGGFEFEYESRDIEINEHEALMSNKHFISTDTGLHIGEYPTESFDSNQLGNIYFEVEKELTYDITNSDEYNDMFNDNEFVEKYDRSDYGLVKLTLDIDPVLYSRWSFQIFDIEDSETIPVYSSALKGIEELGDDKVLMFGVRKLGVFKIRIYLFDYYGGVTWLNPDNGVFNVIRGNVDFKLARIDREEVGFERGLDFWSTFPTKTGVVADRYVEIDAFDSTLNVNTFDEDTHTNLVLRYQSKNFDQRTLQMNTFQFNNVPLNELGSTKLTDYGYEYGRYVVDLIGDGAEGFRRLKMRNFESRDWDEIPLELETGKDHIEYLTEFCSLINSKLGDSVWDKFTATVQLYSEDTIENAIPVIRIVAKEVGISIDNVFVDFTQPDLYNTTVNFSEDYYTLMPISGLIRIYPKFGETSDLVINGNVAETAYTISDTPTFVATLKQYFIDNGIKASVWNYETYIIISNREDIEIQHKSFGLQMDVARGKESSILKVTPAGDLFYKGEPFYAYVDLQTRLDGSDFTWTLTNSLNGEVVDVQNSYVYRNMIMSSGSYTLSLKTTDMFGENIKTKNGFIIVN